MHVCTLLVDLVKRRVSTLATARRKMRNDRVSASFYQIIHISSFLRPPSTTIRPPSSSTLQTRAHNLRERKEVNKFTTDGLVERTPSSYRDSCDVTCKPKTMTRLESPWDWRRRNSSAATQYDTIYNHHHHHHHIEILFYFFLFWRAGNGREKGPSVGRTIATVVLSLWPAYINIFLPSISSSSLW